MIKSIQGRLTLESTGREPGASPPGSEYRHEVQVKVAESRDRINRIEPGSISPETKFDPMWNKSRPGCSGSC